MNDSTSSRHGSSSAAESHFRCRDCSGEGTARIDLGPQPLCNRLADVPGRSVVEHPLALGQCLACGLLQLIDPVAPDLLRVAQTLRYTEPESHLDALVRELTILPGLGKAARIAGVSSKDGSTLDRLSAAGFQNVERLASDRDWGVPQGLDGIADLQAAISRGAADPAKLGRYDLVIARHVFEHAHHHPSFLAHLRRLLRPGGALVLEVPDFSNSLRGKDFSTLWEEHVLYLTPTTLRGVVERSGLEIVGAHVYPYFPEDSLVIIARLGSGAADSGPSRRDRDELDRSLKLGADYGRSLESTAARWRAALRAERVRGNSVTFLGAGHLGIVFLNALGLHDGIDRVFDDDPAKIGKILPNSPHRVGRFPDDGVHRGELCLVSVSPEGEARIQQKYPQFVRAGGRFASIFPDSPISYWNREPHFSENG